MILIAFLHTSKYCHPLLDVINCSLSSKRLPFDLSNLTMDHPLTVLFSTTLAYSKEKNPLTALLLPLSPPGVQRLHNAPPLLCSLEGSKTILAACLRAPPMFSLVLLLLHFLLVILINSLFH